MARKPAGLGRARAGGRPDDTDFLDDDHTRRSLIVLADATAEVIGRGPVYDAIVKVAAISTDDNYRAACAKFDDVEQFDRQRIQAHAIDTLGGTPLMTNPTGPPQAATPASEPGAEVDGLEWATGMMQSFVEGTHGRDGD